MRCSKRVASQISAMVMVALLVLGLSFISPMASLSAFEMNRSIGASTGIAKCTRSCNAANNLTQECIGKADDEPCFSCEFATASTDYGDLPGAPNCDSTAPGWHFPPDAPTTNCGNKRLGKCLNQGCTKQLSNGPTSCTDPPKAVRQTDPG